MRSREDLLRDAQEDINYPRRDGDQLYWVLYRILEVLIDIRDVIWERGKEAM